MSGRYSTKSKVSSTTVGSYTAISDNYETTTIPVLKYNPFFKVKRVEDIIKTINLKQTAFRNDFYSVVLRESGDYKEVNGEFSDHNLFFYSPGQIMTWEISPNCTGWYLIFDKEFLSLNPDWLNFIVDFPFFRLDKTSSVNLSMEDIKQAKNLFCQIFDEFNSDNKDKFLFIQLYTELLLLLTKRYFDKSEFNNENNQDSRKTDVLLVSRFQSMIETLLTSEHAKGEIRQASFYAEKLNVHPNHLNAIVKKITGRTVKSTIQHQFIYSAKSMLRQTDLSTKEIAFKLHFGEPTHFVSFFKKSTGFTPQQYRENPIL